MITRAVDNRGTARRRPGCTREARKLGRTNRGSTISLPYREANNGRRQKTSPRQGLALQLPDGVFIYSSRILPTTWPYWKWPEGASIATHTIKLFCHLRVGLPHHRSCHLRPVITSVPVMASAPPHLPFRSKLRSQPCSKEAISHRKRDNFTRCVPTGEVSPPRLPCRASYRSDSGHYCRFGGSTRRTLHGPG
jgi:hypothetical protein